jgi:heptosyltransferase-2
MQAAVQARRIFVRAPNWVGDLVMATAAFGRMRRAYPTAEIVAGMRPYLRSLLAGTAFFDEIVDVPKARGPRDLWRQAAALRKRRFDLAVVLPNSIETGVIPLLAGIPYRVGYRQGRPGLMNLGLRAPRGRPWWRRHGARRVPKPMPEYYDELLDELGIPPAPRRVSLVVTEAERAAAAEWLGARGVAPGEPLVALNPGASFGASKLWEPDRFAAVARHFQERRGLRALLLAGPAEVEAVRAMAAASGALAAIDPVLPVGMLKPLLERAAVLITTDSGPRHIGVALGVPVVCLMGPNDRRYTDYQLERQRVIRKDLECSPCQRKVCPLGHRRCMTDIGVAEVIEAAQRLLEP